MVDNITSITSFREKKEKKEKIDKKKKNIAAIEAKITIIADDLLARWGAAAKVNMLDEFLIHHLELEEKEYISDLNALAEVENNIGLTLAIFHPGMSPYTGADGGFVAAIKYGESLLSTPMMTSENLARAFAIAFYNDLVKSNMFDEMRATDE